MATHNQRLRGIASFDLYLDKCRGDVWTLETKDRDYRALELFAPFKNAPKKKVAAKAAPRKDAAE